MELDIAELDFFDEPGFEENFDFDEEEKEDIPENIIPEPISNKKTVKFSRDTKPLQEFGNKVEPLKKMINQKPPPVKPQISYDEILSKMGMFVADGKLHLMDNLSSEKKNQILQQTVGQNQNQNQNNVEQVPYVKQNTYIHNKYFNKDVKEESQVRVPKNVYEYRNMLINDIIQRQRIKQLKSTRLVLPDTNIHFAPNSNANLNKLFNFSLR
jgi:hypothetical protein